MKRLMKNWNKKQRMNTKDLSLITFSRKSNSKLKNMTSLKEIIVLKLIMNISRNIITNRYYSNALIKNKKLECMEK